MSVTPSSRLLGDDVWHGRIFNGSWCNGASEAEVNEPATGKRLACIGMADGTEVASLVRTVF
ncbi:hypothetical protein LGM65_32705 [Burkholderia anthina]|uniref:hypothetical protein n=1 Tax=Burkholderia anthina TaxID=179879 RepID=UPI001CF11D91|nr:hypothetical protein [Burkholderia anthina]MCA8095563.1 hypothetical protein [Burkholderia anthina]